MTVKLYDQEPYKKEFSAKVLECTKVTRTIDDKEVECYRVILDSTCFFPEEGGQTSDRGLFNGTIEVFDIQLENGDIAHFCLEEVSGIVTGEIDWEHRFNNMQQHTGEHIFTGIAHKRFGVDNVGFHLSENVVTLDLNKPLTALEIEEVERAANEVIFSNVKVKAWYPTESELGAIDYRSKIELSGNVRIVEIEGVDICACCAPHVRSTGEVGILKVQSITNYKGGVRVSILCGKRALEDYANRIKLLEDAYHKLNCPQEQITNRIQGLLDDNRTLKSKMQEINFANLKTSIESLGEEDPSIIFTESVDAKVLRDAVNLLMEKRKEGICAVFSKDDKGGYNYIVGSNDIDARLVASVLKEKLMAKGGGSDRMIQGSVIATEEEILGVINGRNI